MSQQSRASHEQQRSPHGAQMDGPGTTRPASIPPSNDRPSAPASQLTAAEGPARVDQAPTQGTSEQVDGIDNLSLRNHISNEQESSSRRIPTPPRVASPVPNGHRRNTSNDVVGMSRGSLRDLNYPANVVVTDDDDEEQNASEA